MKKILAISICALLLGSCATIPKQCRVTGSGAYKGHFRVCLECDTSATHFKAEVLKQFDKQKKK